MEEKDEKKNLKLTLDFHHKALAPEESLLTGCDGVSPSGVADQLDVLASPAFALSQHS